MSDETLSILVQIENLASAGLTKLKEDLGQVGTVASTSTPKVNQFAQGLDASSKAGSNFHNVLIGIGQGMGQAFFSFGQQALHDVMDFFATSGAAADAMNKAVGKSDIVFGQFANQLTDWSRSAADAMGLSTTAALEDASAVGNLATSAGVAQGKALEMSKGIVKLASDLASFNNVDPAQTLKDLEAGLSGSTKGLKLLGIVVSQADINQRLLLDGAVKVNKQYTDAELIQARYEVILEKASNASGDFARNTNSLADAQARENAQLDNLKAKVGQDTIGPQILFYQAIDQSAKAAGDAADAFGYLGDTLKTKTRKPITDNVTELGHLNQMLKDMTGGLINMNPEVTTAGALLDHFGNQALQASKDADQSFGINGTAPQAMLQFGKDADQVFGDGGVVPDAIATTLATMVNFPSQMAKDLTSGWSAVQSAAKGLADAMKHPISEALREKQLQDDLSGKSSLGQQIIAGLKSSDPLAVAAAKALKDDVTAELLTLETNWQFKFIKDRNTSANGGTPSTTKTPVHSSASTTNHPTTPKHAYASGGWAGVYGPEIASIGENEPELVIPRSRLMAGMASAGSSSRPIVIQLVADGRVLAEVVGPHLDQMNGRHLALMGSSGFGG